MGLGNWFFKKIMRYYNQDIKADRHSYLCDYDKIAHEIIPGDVLLVEGTNRISRVIKSVTNSPWTHAAIYVGRLHSIEDPQSREVVRKNYIGSPTEQLLVDTIPGHGTNLNPISIYKHHHIRICRPTGISNTDAQQVIKYVISRIGYTYNTRHFLDLGRFLLSSRWYLPSRWRSSLFQSKPGKGKVAEDICSSMIAKAFTEVQFPILPLIRSTKDKPLEMIHRNPKLFTPSDFDYSPYFSIIKYPIFHLSGHKHYSDLPWRKDLLSQDGTLTQRDEEAEKPTDANKKEQKVNKSSENLSSGEETQ